MKQVKSTAAALMIGTTLIAAVSVASCRPSIPAAKYYSQIEIQQVAAACYHMGKDADFMDANSQASLPEVRARALAWIKQSEHACFADRYNYP